MESKFFFKLGDVGFKVAQPLDHAAFGVSDDVFKVKEPLTLGLNCLQVVFECFNNSLNGVIMGFEMLKDFFQIILVVRKLAIRICKLFTELCDFILDLLVKDFTLSNVLFTLIDGFHQCSQLTKHVAVKVHCWRNDHNRVTLGEGDDCDSIASRPLT